MLDADEHSCLAASVERAGGRVLSPNRSASRFAYSCDRRWPRHRNCREPSRAGHRGPVMRIAVAGATGLVGQRFVRLAIDAGAEVTPMTRSHQVDLFSGVGVHEALEGADVVVDLVQSPSFDEREATHFFRRVALVLGRTAARVGVRRSVVLSVVACDRLTTGDAGLRTRGVLPREARPRNRHGRGSSRSAGAALRAALRLRRPRDQAWACRRLHHPDSEPAYSAGRSAGNRPGLVRNGLRR